MCFGAEEVTDEDVKKALEELADRKKNNAVRLLTLIVLVGLAFSNFFDPELF